jgi:hypothetical protein
LAGWQAGLTLTNGGGNHTATVDVETAVLLNMGGTNISIPKQPSVQAQPPVNGGGVGGNPYVWVRFINTTTGDDLTGNILLGRCVQGGATLTDISFLEAVLASATISVDADTCNNNPGPNIYINNGVLSLSGVTARVIFTNNTTFNHGTHEADVDAAVNIDLAVGGNAISIPKQPVLGGAGGNPNVYFIFLDSSGNPVGTPPGQFLGKCHKI